MEDGVPEAESLFHPREVEGKEEEEEEDEHKRKKAKGAEEEEEKGGGLLNNLISNLVSPKAGENKGKVGVFEQDGSGGRDKKQEQPISKEEVDGENGGGLINNIISNIFHLKEGDEAMENQKKDREDDEKVKDVQVTEERQGGIIENIVSHLPPSLPDGVAPTTDEASILIHSIIHD